MTAGVNRKEPRMDEYIAFDSHKKYTLAEREEASSGRVCQQRIEHRPGAIREYLRACPAGTAVAVEATGNWYWIVAEIEQAGMVPRLVHPRKAKLMMGMINKTDKLDVHGLNRLQRNQTLPEVWIPPGELRDLRELTRTRMVLTNLRTRLKNRLGATVAKYGLSVGDWSDPFGKAAREKLTGLLRQLPEQSGWVSAMLLKQIDLLDSQVGELEKRIEQLVPRLPAIELLRTLPGIGPILSAVMALEIGDVGRFASGERLASYSGTTPRVISSGDKTRYGRLRADVNRYLKWAFVEAANSVAVHRGHYPQRHVTRLYERLRARRGHAKAVGAVARHLAEAAWHVLSRNQPYRDPALARNRQAAGQTTKAQARTPHESRCGSRSECDAPCEHVHAPSRAKR
jgi:transposase